MVLYWVRERDINYWQVHVESFVQLNAVCQVILVSYTFLFHFKLSHIHHLFFRILYHNMGQTKDSLQSYVCAVYLDSSRHEAWTDMGCLYESVSQPM